MNRQLVKITILLFTLISVPTAQKAGDSTTRIGAFTYVKTVDPMTDADASFIFTADGDRLLSWSCTESKSTRFSLAFFHGTYFTGYTDGTVYVQYRFPPEKAVLESWFNRAPQRLVVAPLANVEEFTKKALAADTLVIQAHDRDGDSVTVTFKLDGLPKALSQLPCAAKAVPKI